MPEILAVVNQKGGVGKTTTTINLGAALGALERRVLIVDSDRQGNATRGLGVDDVDPSLYEVVLGESTLEEAIRPTGFPFLDIVPAHRDLVGVEVELVGQDGWEKTLQKCLAGGLDAYDFVFIDCPPSLGHLTVNALVAADKVVVPIQCEYFALEGISELVHTVSRVRAAMNPGLAIGGVLLTMYDDRTNLARDVVSEVRAHFPREVYNTIIPRNVRLAEAPSHGLPVLDYDIKSRGAQAYLALAQEHLERAA